MIVLNTKMKSLKLNSISIGKKYECAVFCKYLIITINSLYKIYFKLFFDTGKPEHVYDYMKKQFIFLLFKL